MFDLDNRTRGQLVFSSVDLESQLEAIRSILRRNARASNEHDSLVVELNDSAKNAPNSEHGAHLIDRAVDAFHMGIFHDAANSMAAVGMLAPLIETMMDRLFREFSKKFERNPNSPRFRLGDEYWNPRQYAASSAKNDRQDIILGFKQLAQEIGIDEFFDPQLNSTLEALFAYRNKMFHNGFEWPPGLRASFARRILDEGWDRWFSRATSGDDPWIFYMNSAFIEHCLEHVEQLVLSAGRFHRKAFEE